MEIDDHIFLNGKVLPGTEVPLGRAVSGRPAIATTPARLTGKCLPAAKTGKYEKRSTTIPVNCMVVILMIPSPTPVNPLTLAKMKCGNKSVINPIKLAAKALMPSDAIQISTIAPVVVRATGTSTAERLRATPAVRTVLRALFTGQPRPISLPYSQPPPIFPTPPE